MVAPRTTIDYLDYNSVYLEEMFELVRCFVRIFADAFAKDDGSFVEKNVALHSFQSKLAKSVPFAFRPDTKTSLKKQTTEFSKTSL